MNAPSPDYIARVLTDAISRRDAARAAFNTARAGSKAWRDAGDDLDFWIGKVANMEAAASFHGGRVDVLDASGAFVRCEVGRVSDVREVDGEEAFAVVRL